MTNSLVAMDGEIVELEALRFYGQEGPIAIINIRGERKAYTMPGIESLISEHTAAKQEQLISIKKAMIQARQQNYQQLPDVQKDDISGQEPLFS